MFSNLNNLGVPPQASTLGLPAQSGQSISLFAGLPETGNNAPALNQAFQQTGTLQSSLTSLVDTVAMMFQANPFSSQGIQPAPDSSRKSGVHGTAKAKNANTENDDLFGGLITPNSIPSSPPQPPIASGYFEFKPLMDLRA